jgi:hypothetical protein
MENKRLWRIAAAALIVGTACLRIAYLTHNCPLDLAPDEAHYWDWSRHLDWSYYSKGPLVAYLIRAGCILAGDWSRALTGTEMAAVRLPAVVCGSLLLTSLYVLTIQILGRERLAFGVVAAALCSPLIAAGSSLMTIDAPYTCCWGWALVVGHRAIFKQSTWAWPLLGLLIGIGILAKYTMILWIPSAILFLLATPQHRAVLVRPGFWIATGLAVACCLPIFAWNLQHNGITFRHVSGQAGLAGNAIFRWWGPFAYVGVQFALLLGFWFCAWALALIRYRPGKAIESGISYLWWMSVPMFALFLTFSLITTIEPNWPVTTYLSGIILAAAWIGEQMQSVNKLRVQVIRSCLAGACALGASLIVFVHHSEWFYPNLAYLVGRPTAERPLPLRRLDPTCRLRGWRVLARELDLVRDQLEREGIDPVIAGVNWNIPGEIGFYCKGNPTVYTLGLVLGDRHSQYDLWRPNPIADATQFNGRTFIVVGDLHPRLRDAFQQLDEPRLVYHTAAGQPVACWEVCVCRGFRGLRDATNDAASRRF